MKTAHELGRYDNHPLRNEGLTCKKCKKGNVMPPMHLTDWFDCLDCGHSWEPTENQKKKLANGVIIEYRFNQ